MNRNPYCLLSALFVFAVSSIASIASAQDYSKVWQDGVKSSVLVKDTNLSGHGSGSVVNVRDGYIITNWHVVFDARFEAEKKEAIKNKKPMPVQKMLVLFPMWEDGRLVVEDAKYKAQERKLAIFATVIASEERVDLAVIKIDDLQKIPTVTTSVKLAGAPPLPGSKLISIGNPGASKGLWIYTGGEVRSTYQSKWESRAQGGKEIHSHNCLIIEATSPTNAGDSGGPCFNDKGEQVGVTHGGLDARAANNFSTFIDAAEVKTFLKKNKVEFNLANDGPAAEIAKKDAPPVVAEVKKDGMPDVKTNPMPKKDQVLKDPPKKDPAADPMNNPPPVDPVAAKKAADENLAAGALRLLRPLATNPDKKSYAVGKLQELIKMYPDTEAAKEAKELLNKIK